MYVRARKWGCVSGRSLTLLPRSFHYINDKNKHLSTRGVAMQIMKHNDISPAQFRVDMVKKWQGIEESS
jgi:hypothetical protein